MKAILLISSLILIILGGQCVISIQTSHIARMRWFLHLLGSRFNVHAKITPLWNVPRHIGTSVYCGRIYAVSFQVSK